MEISLGRACAYNSQVLQEDEVKRLEDIRIRLRTQRHEADERKREREVKITDRVPPAKRPRNGCMFNLSLGHSITDKYHFIQGQDLPNRKLFFRKRARRLPRFRETYLQRGQFRPCRLTGRTIAQ